MKVFQFAIWTILGFSQLNLAESSVSDFSKKSIVFIIKDNSLICNETAINTKIYPLFKKLKEEYFKKTDAHFLINNLSIPLKLLAPFAQRKISDYDIMVRLDLQSDLTSEQIKALFAIKKTLLLSSSKLVLFLSNNHQFLKISGTEKTDVVMGFITKWHPDLSMEDAQAYWLNNHGPLVIQVGLPPVVKSYTQVHVDTTGRFDLFDKTIQGLSFETITGQRKFIKYFLLNPSVRELNNRLLEDELHFSPSSELFAFRELHFF